jgi:Protein of unknown function (DUF4232)
MISPATAARRLLAAAALACVASLAVGCGSMSAPGANPTVTVAVPASGPASATAPASQLPAGATGAAAPACPNNSLSVTHEDAGVAAGTAYQRLVFTNTSGTACTLYGYPGVSFVTGVGGSMIGVPAGEDPVSPRTLVTLAPGGQASALLGTGTAIDYPQSTCQPVNATWLRIYPPGQTSALYLRDPAQTCSAAVPLMHVDVVLAGTGS